MKIRVKTPPTTEPILTSFAKEVLRIDGTESDSIIAALITAGRQFAEETTGISIAEKTYELAYDCYPPNIIKLPYPTLISLDAVTITNDSGVTSSMSTTSFVADMFGSTLAKKDGIGYPSTTLQEVNGVIIEYTSGFETVPEDVKQAILLYVKAQFECIPPEEWMPSFQRLIYHYKVVEV